MSEISILCREEGKIVGNIEFHGNGPVRLDAPTILRSFRPVSDDYRISSAVSRGHALKCPKCQNALSIAGQLKTFESKKSVSVDDVAIIVGVTKVGVQ